MAITFKIFEFSQKVGGIIIHQGYSKSYQKMGLHIKIGAFKLYGTQKKDIFVKPIASSLHSESKIIQIESSCHRFSLTDTK